MHRRIGGQAVERLGVHGHAARLILAGKIHVEDGHLPGRLLDIPGPDGERLDLHRGAGQRGMLADHDACRCLVAGDELAAEIAELDRLLPHGIVLLVTVAKWQAAPGKRAAGACRTQ